MTMQRKITMSDRLDMPRVLAALQKTDEFRRIKIKMLSMAGANQPGIKGWFVLQTAERREKTVEQTLANENILAYLPLIDGGKVVRRHRAVQLPERPALPGYVMVHVVASAAAFCGLRRIDGVIGIVGGAENPHRIPDEEMNRFKIKLGDYDPASAHADVFKDGDWVRFDEGPFIGLQGRVWKIRKALLVRGMRKIAVSGTVDLEVGGQRHSIDCPLALLQKL